MATFPRNVWKRSRALAGAATVTVVVGGLLIGGIAPAQAQEPTSDSTTGDVSSLDAQDKWGINHDGWQLTVTNDIFGKDLYFDDTYSRGVTRARVQIASGTTSSDTRGRISALGGPKNLLISYMSSEPERYPSKSDLAPGWRRFVSIDSKTSGETSVYCGVMQLGIFWNDYQFTVGCDVLKDNPTEPIWVDFNELRDGPWKAKGL